MLAAVLLVGGMQVPVKAQENSMQKGTNLLAEKAGITVYTRDEFMDALKQKKSPITVAAVISVGDEAETDGRMRPVLIPSGLQTDVLIFAVLFSWRVTVSFFGILVCIFYLQMPWGVCLTGKYFLQGTALPWIT